MSPLFPLEIVLRCMNELADNPAALKNCALIHILHEASQALLFSAIHIDTNKAGSYLCVQQLASSSRIISYIRHLKVYLEISNLTEWETWLGSKAQILLGFLQMVPVAKICSFSFQDHRGPHNLTSLHSTDPPTARALLHDIAQICTGQLLHSLEVGCMQSQVLLRVCSPLVRNLFVGQQLPTSDSPRGEVNTTDVASRVQSMNVKNLKLVWGHDPVDWEIIHHHLLDPQGLFNLGTLTHLHLFGGRNWYNEKIKRILSRCQDSLTSLVIGSVSTAPVAGPQTLLGFAKLKNLRLLHLTLPLYGPDASDDRAGWLVDELALFEHNSKLENSTFTYMSLPGYILLSDVQNWDSISLLLCQDNIFPSLQRVEVSIRHAARNQEENIEYPIFNDLMSKLSASFRWLLAQGVFESRHLGLEDSPNIGKVFYHYVQPRIEPARAT
ncbi:hypothetical protein BKA70DRAFT_1225063 [Coprinopsis sp. MPI-PUGE-AT-0042]|nr:hypothetical protein BKA70DRAFT_1225063 [Coprinopsis sp. MPI-PUGE-AT-0042]